MLLILFNGGGGDFVPAFGPLCFEEVQAKSPWVQECDAKSPWVKNVQARSPWIDEVQVGCCDE